MFYVNTFFIVLSDIDFTDNSSDMESDSSYVFAHCPEPLGSRRHVGAATERCNSLLIHTEVNPGSKFKGSNLFSR